MDGPFTEAKEVVGGFAIFDAPSKAEMLEMDPPLHGSSQDAYPWLGGRSEVRQIAGPGEKLCDQAHETQAAAV